MPQHTVANEKSPLRSLERLRGRWLCSVHGGGTGAQVVASGVLDLLHAGSYLVGSAGPQELRATPSAAESVAAVWTATLEGSVFGTVRGDEVVFWLADRAGSAVWVLQGHLDLSGGKITGSASYTDAARATEPPLEGSFSLVRL